MRAKVSRMLRKEAGLKLGRNPTPRNTSVVEGEQNSLSSENPARKLYKSLKKHYLNKGTKLQ